MSGNNSDLFELVKRLDPSEDKRIRRLQSLNQDDGETNYYQLYHDLRESKVSYNERAFKANHADRQYLKSYPQNKIYLYNLILDALRGQRQRFGIEKPIEFQIYEMLEDAHLLKQKLLVNQSLRRLLRARKEAEKYEYFELLLEILKRLRTHHNENVSKQSRKMVEEVLQSIEQVSKIIALNSNLLVVRDRFFLQARSGGMGAKDAPIQDLIRQVKELKSPRIPSTEARLNYHLIKGLNCQLSGNSIQRWRHFRATYLIWQSAAHYRETRQLTYRKHLNNYLTISIASAKFVGFVHALDQLGKGPFRSQDEATEAKQNELYIRLQFFMTCAQWENAKLVEKAFIEDQNLLGEKLQAPRKMAFHLSFAKLNFVIDQRDVNGLVKNHLSEFDQIHLDGNHDDKLADACLLRQMLLFAKCQETAVDLDNSIRNTLRSLKKMSRPPAYANEIAGAIKRVYDTFDEQDKKHIWKDLYAKLSIHQSSQPYDGSLNFFLAWAKAQQLGSNLKNILEADKSER